MKTFISLILLLFLTLAGLKAQDAEIDRLMQSELKMTFPSIYFKHNSTDYAAMPYTADSCFKYVAFHFKDNINSLVIWRDSMETEELTDKRIKKLKESLNKYVRKGKIEIYSMEQEQKLSRKTINTTTDSTQIEYLLSFNSVLDISKSRYPTKAAKNKSHILHPKIWCGACWKSGFHMNKSGREYRKMARRTNNASKQK